MTTTYWSSRRLAEVRSYGNLREQKPKTVKGNKGLHDLEGPRGFVSQGAFSADGTLVATAAEDGVRVWRMADLGAPIVLRGHDGTVFSVGFDPDGTTVASASSDAKVRIWSIEPALRTERREALLQEDAGPSTEASSILAREGGCQLVWDASTSPPELRVEGWLRPVSLGQPRGFGRPAAAAIAPHSNFVLVAPGEQGRPLLYDLASPEAPVAVFGEMDTEWRAVAFAPDVSHPTGMTAAGEEHAWTFFPDRANLIEFARKHLPQEGGAPARLSGDDLCQLGLTPR
jgi:WD40 repeat protein